MGAAPKVEVIVEVNLPRFLNWTKGLVAGRNRTS